MHAATTKRQRMTRQRLVILETLRQTSDHPTADILYDEVRKKLPHISMGTVYRNLEMLAASGLISVLQPERTQMRFDANVGGHYHMTCTRCGALQDLPYAPSDDAFKNLENALGTFTKYGIFGHKLEFFGLCEKCQSLENEEVPRHESEGNENGKQPDEGLCG